MQSLLFPSKMFEASPPLSLFVTASFSLAAFEPPGGVVLHSVPPHGSPLFYIDNPRVLIESLYDDISVDRLEIDMIDFSGPAFQYVDNRLMSLQLVKLGMTDAVIFNSQGNNMLPADILYKKMTEKVHVTFLPLVPPGI